MPLQVYDTLTRAKMPFEPLVPGRVTMYVCGPTVYKPSHIGHMVGPVIFDTVKRYLVYRGYEVKWVVNITDVDDKLIVRARELNTTVKELAERMTADYVENLKRLNVAGIDHMPRATDHIPEMLAMIQKLIATGHAYPAGGDVYFDVTKDDDYGKLANRKPEEMEAGARVEVREQKRHPGDFALWKASKPGEPSWDGPWGPGRPGWHIECSAMSVKWLGETLDIHGGGLDLQFPHHENELAQSESVNGKPFARAWMHNGLLQMGKEKMAGSVGNVVNVADLLKEHHPETVRFLLLSTHYRSPIEYNADRLKELRRAMDAFYRFFERVQRVTGASFHALAAPTTFAPLDVDLGEVGELRDRFLDCMDDDFNTGGAVGVLYELLNALNRFADEAKLENPNPPAEAVALFRRKATVLRELSRILGLFEQPIGAATADDGFVDGLMQLLVDVRNESRKAKNFAIADTIRQRLGELGVTLEDRPGGTGWRKV